MMMGGYEAGQGKGQTGRGMLVKHRAVGIDVGELVDEQRNHFGWRNQLIGADDFKSAYQFPDHEKDDEADDGNPVLAGGCSKIVGFLDFEAQGLMGLFSGFACVLHGRTPWFGGGSAGVEHGRSDRGG